MPQSEGNISLALIDIVFGLSDVGFLDLARMGPLGQQIFKFPLSTPQRYLSATDLISVMDKSEVLTKLVKRLHDFIGTHCPIPLFGVRHPLSFTTQPETSAK